MSGGKHPARAFEEMFTEECDLDVDEFEVHVQRGPDGGIASMSAHLTEEYDGE